MDYQEHITRDPKICGGEAVVRGTRVTVRTILASLAEGSTVGEILADFPTLKEEDVWAVVAFAAASAQEDMPLRATPNPLQTSDPNENQAGREPPAANRP